MKKRVSVRTKQDAKKCEVTPPHSWSKLKGSARSHKQYTEHVGEDRKAATTLVNVRGGVVAVWWNGRGSGQTWTTPAGGRAIRHGGTPAPNINTNYQTRKQNTSHHTPATTCPASPLSTACGVRVRDPDRLADRAQAASGRQMMPTPAPQPRAPHPLPLCGSRPRFVRL